MTFAAPAALWGLFLLPAIVLLYLLRARRQDVPVSSLLLWQRARRDLAAQRPARRLERSLLLLLQLLAAALLVLALARPQVHLAGAGRPATAIVVDVSASMQATDATPSRLNAALRAARQIVEAAPGPVMVVTAGAIPRVIAPLGERAAALAALARLRPADGPSRLAEAVTLALGQLAPGGAPRVEVFTDRAGAALPGVTYHVVGTQSRNVGIAAVAVEPAQSGPVLVVKVQNAGDRPERVPVVVSEGARRLAQRTVTVPPGAQASLTVPVASGGMVRVELAVADLLAVDNVAHVPAGVPPPRVIVAGVPDRVLAEALRAIPVRFAPAQRITPEALASADVVILNRTPAVELPPGNYLLFGTTAPNLPLAVDGRVRAPQVLRWSVRHPVTRYVDLTDLTIGEALRLVPQGGEVLAEGETPLLWAYEGNGVRAVVSAFALDQSDLPLRVGFPILLSNALTWLSGAGHVYTAGEAIVIPAGSHGEAELQGPDGTRTRLAASGGRFVIPAAERAGLYVLRAGSRAWTLVVNPSPEEIVIAPAAPAPRSGAPAVAGPRETRDVWAALLLLAVLVLCVEWWVWLRSLPRAARRSRRTSVLRPEHRA